VHFIAHNAIIIQLIGFIALGFSLLVFQVNRRSSMLKLQMCAASLYVVHFYLLGAITGSAMNLTGVSRNYAFYKFRDRTHSWLLPGVFIIIFAGVGLATWQGPLSLLPTCGMISGTIAFWQRDTKFIRYIALISPPLWFTYNAISGSYPGMLTEVIMFSSNLVGIYRFDV
jgi:hypothetical protein